MTEERKYVEKNLFKAVEINQNDQKDCVYIKSLKSSMTKSILIGFVCFFALFSIKMF